TAASVAALVSAMRNGVGRIGSVPPLNSTALARSSPQPAIGRIVRRASLVMVGDSSIGSGTEWTRRSGVYNTSGARRSLLLPIDLVALARFRKALEVALAVTAEGEGPTRAQVADDSSGQYLARPGRGADPRREIDGRPEQRAGVFERLARGEPDAHADRDGQRAADVLAMEGAL